MTGDDLKKAVDMVRDGFENAQIVLRLIGREMPDWFDSAVMKVLTFLSENADTLMRWADSLANWLSGLSTFGVAPEALSDMLAEMAPIQTEIKMIRALA